MLETVFLCACNFCVVFVKLVQPLVQCSACENEVPCAENPELLEVGSCMSE